MGLLINNLYSQRWYLHTYLGRGALAAYRPFVCGLRAWNGDELVFVRIRGRKIIMKVKWAAESGNYKPNIDSSKCWCRMRRANWETNRMMKLASGGAWKGVLSRVKNAWYFKSVSFIFINRGETFPFFSHLNYTNNPIELLSDSHYNCKKFR